VPKDYWAGSDRTAAFFPGFLNEAKNTMCTYLAYCAEYIFIVLIMTGNTVIIF